MCFRKLFLLIFITGVKCSCTDQLARPLLMANFPSHFPLCKHFQWKTVSSVVAKWFSRGEGDPLHRRCICAHAEVYLSSRTATNAISAQIEGHSKKATRCWRRRSCAYSDSMRHKEGDQWMKNVLKWSARRPIDPRVASVETTDREAITPTRNGRQKNSSRPARSLLRRDTGTTTWTSWLTTWPREYRYAVGCCIFTGRREREHRNRITLFFILMTFPGIVPGTTTTAWAYNGRRSIMLSKVKHFNVDMFR